MILYIDETQNDNYFIVAGVLFDSKETADLTYKQFKKAASHYPISPKLKQKVFNEFKATLLDRSFLRLKNILLNGISSNCNCVIYSITDIANVSFNQQDKELAYITLLNNIVRAISVDVEVVCDNFNLKGFEDKIISTLSLNSNVISIKTNDSKLEGGLQFADNVCSTIRHYYAGTNLDFYEIIRKVAKKV